MIPTPVAIGRIKTVTFNKISFIFIFDPKTNFEKKIINGKIIKKIRLYLARKANAKKQLPRNIFP